MARHKTTKQQVAIKLITDCFRNSIIARKTFREIRILRKLSMMPQNIFTTKLLDIIMPVEEDSGSNSDVLENEGDEGTAAFEGPQESA